MITSNLNFSSPYPKAIPSLLNLHGYTVTVIPTSITLETVSIPFFLSPNVNQHVTFSSLSRPTEDLCKLFSRSPERSQVGATGLSDRSRSLGRPSTSGSRRPPVVAATTSLGRRFRPEIVRKPQDQADSVWKALEICHQRNGHGATVATDCSSWRNGWKWSLLECSQGWAGRNQGGAGSWGGQWLSGRRCSRCQARARWTSRRGRVHQQWWRITAKSFSDRLSI